MKRSVAATKGGSLWSLPPVIRRWLLAAALFALALTAPACTTTSSPIPKNSPQASAGTSCRLTVSITTTSGTTWGTVTATSGGTSFTFGSANRTVSLPCGATANLKERPTDSNSWPFHDWQVGTERVTGTSTSTVVNGADQVSAVYVSGALGAASPTPSGSGD